MLEIARIFLVLHILSGYVFVVVIDAWGHPRGRLLRQKVDRLIIFFPHRKWRVRSLLERCLCLFFLGDYGHATRLHPWHLCDRWTHSCGHGLFSEIATFAIECTVSQEFVWVTHDIGMGVFPIDGGLSQRAPLPTIPPPHLLQHHRYHLRLIHHLINKIAHINFPLP